jgi:hypothetical protein
VYGEVGVDGIPVEEARSAAQGVAGPVWCEVEMQVRRVIAEDEDVGLVGVCRVAQSLRDASKHRAERGGLRPVQVGDERNVTPGLEVRKSRYRALQDGGQPPERVLPDPDTLELSVGGGWIAEQASGSARTPIGHGRTLLPFDAGDAARGRRAREES